MSKYSQLFIFSFFIVLIAACGNKYNEDEFTAAIKASFTAKDSTAKLSRSNTSAMVYAIYKKNDFKPVWITTTNAVGKAKKLKEDIELLEHEGIPLKKYDLKKLQARIEAVEKHRGTLETKDAIDFDKGLTSLYIQAANDVLYGVTDPDDATDMWFHTNDTVVNIANTFKTDEYYSLSHFKSKWPLYEALVQHNRELENLQGVNTDSMRNVINANLERLRWLPQAPEEDYVLVVVPMMELFLVDDGNVKMNMKTVVGRKDRETPALNADMKDVVFNPSWGVPPGIMRKDVVPGILDKGEAYLNKKGLTVYDREGNEVPASKVTKKNYKNYIVRQAPSERNALGQVKFNLPNPWAIYLHDTPSRSDFEKEDRYKSSGCVRLEKPKELAYYILTEMNDKDYTKSEIDEIVSHNNTEYVDLKHKLPVHILYLTAYNINGDLEFYEDIYSRDGQIAQLLR